MSARIKIPTWKLQNIKDETYNFKDLIECENGDWVAMDDYNQLEKENKELRERLVKYEQEAVKSLNKIGAST